MYRILVVGERPEEAKATAFRLGLLGHEAAPSASDPMLVLRSLFAFKPDVLLLDASDSKAARELFQLVYKVSELPVLVLGDGANDEDVVWFLEEGAADYLVRPVAAKLLAARITALLRRTSTNGASQTIQAGHLEIDPQRHIVHRQGRAVSLTPTEFRLLRVLAENAGSACSHRFLLQQVWGEDFRECSHYLRLYIGYLRQKLEEDPRNPRVLLTEWGVGYRLVADQRDKQRAALRPKALYA